MSKERPEEKSPGRPSKYRTKYCQEIVELARKGQTFQMIACGWGVHVDSLHEWAKAYPEFSEAKKLAKQCMEAHMQQIGLAGMLGKIKGFQAGSWIFWMKAQHSWDEGGQIDQDDDYGLEFV